jgi:regulation of enolase protein 1 (concanavalin A-like superfamily)
VETGDRTDFWQGTFYGFRRDDGHFLGAPVESDFTAHVTFSGEYRELYDQAGCMLRVDGGTWIKAGVEHSDGMANVSTVVTRSGRSDWSVIGVPGLEGPQSIRFTRIGEAVILHVRQAEGWTLMRLADFPVGPALFGPMCCSPERAGFRAVFQEVRVGPPIEHPLHGPWAD